MMTSIPTNLRAQPNLINSTHDVDTLKKSLHNTEQQLNRVKDQEYDLQSRQQEANSQVNHLRDECRRLASLNERQALELQDFKTKQESLTMGNTSVVHTLDRKFRDFQTNLQTKEEDIQALNSQVHERNNTIQLLKMNESNAQYQIYNTKEKAEQLAKENQRLRDQNYELKRKTENLTVERSSEATAQLEVEHLKKDNQRLLDLLKNTQYKGLSEYGETCGTINFVSQQDFRDDPCLDKKVCSISDKLLDAIVDEAVPTDTLSLALELRNKYGSELTPNLISRLLQELNRIWRQREKHSIVRIQTRASREVNDVKRKHQMQESYDDVMVKRKIARLEEDLRRSRAEINRLAVESRSKIRGDSNSEGVKSSMKIMNEFQLEKKRLQEELNQQKNKNSELEVVLKDREPERKNTMEGIGFMGAKMLIELDSFENKFKSQYKGIANMLAHVDINSRLGIEKKLDEIGEEIQELRRRTDNSITLNNFNLTTSFKTSSRY